MFYSKLQWHSNSSAEAMKEAQASDDDDDVADATPTSKERRCCRRQNVVVHVSRYFKGRKSPVKPPFVLTGKAVKWTPPKSPYNLIQVVGIIV